jgi:hypothetical protein
MTLSEDSVHLRHVILAALGLQVLRTARDIVDCSESERSPWPYFYLLFFLNFSYLLFSFVCFFQ